MSDIAGAGAVASRAFSRQLTARVSRPGNVSATAPSAVTERPRVVESEVSHGLSSAGERCGRLRSAASDRPRASTAIVSRGRAQPRSGVVEPVQHPGCQPGKESGHEDIVTFGRWARRAGTRWGWRRYAGTRPGPGTA